MPLRYIITIDAAPGKGTAFARALEAICKEGRREPGCEQYEVFQSVLDPDKLVVLELWTDQAALDAHMKVDAARGPLPPGQGSGTPGCEAYEYNRIR
jgi:quinol monooxygenase YgiN